MTEAVKKKIPAMTLAVVVTITVILSVYFLNASTANGDTTAKADAATATGEDAAAKTPIPVEAVTVATGAMASYLSATANLVPENEVQVLAESDGRVARLTVEEGSRVERGTVLAELDRRDAEIAVKKARVRASTQEHAFERARKLRDQELLSQEEFDKVALENEIAAQELAEAERRLEKTVIRAPFAGRVTLRMVQLGQHVRPGDELFTVADFEPLVARIYLPERDVLPLAPGQPVQVALRADDAVTFAGRIQQISPVVDTATGTVKVTVATPAVPAAVRPGAFVRVDIVRDEIADAVLVPREAVVRELQKSYVFVAGDGKAEKRAVELGIEENGHFEARAGVRAGERVIVAGQGGLKDGSPITVLGAGAEDGDGHGRAAS